MLLSWILSTIFMSFACSSSSLIADKCVAPQQRPVSAAITPTSLPYERIKPWSLSTLALESFVCLYIDLHTHLCAKFNKLTNLKSVLSDVIKALCGWMNCAFIFCCVIHVELRMWFSIAFLFSLSRSHIQRHAHGQSAFRNCMWIKIISLK